jgi:ankyrin repeat protein
MEFTNVAETRSTKRKRDEKEEKANMDLINASRVGDTQKVANLLSQEGIDVNAKNNPQKYTALIIASRRGHIEVVKKLLAQEGIDVNAKNNANDTALIFASANGYTKIVKELLKKPGILLDEKNNIQRTALHSASIYGHKDIVEILLVDGADINVKDNNNNTALWWANLNTLPHWYNNNIDKYREIVELLIRKGATITDSEYTPIQNLQNLKNIKEGITNQERRMVPELLAMMRRTGQNVEPRINELIGKNLGGKRKTRKQKSKKSKRKTKRKTKKSSKRNKRKTRRV